MPQAPTWQDLRNPAVLAPIIVVALLAAWWLWGAAAHPVKLITPTRGDAAEVVYATGIVEPKLWAKVVALERKRIVELCACEGQTVTKGDVLARLDDIEERAVLTELQARRATISDDVERTKMLVDRNAVSRVSLDEKRTRLAEIDARIAAQQDRIYDLVLRAPMSGTVLWSDGEVGEIAGIGVNDALFWVGQPKPLQIDAEVNEEDIAKVKRGQRVLLRHDGYRNGPLPATVKEITPKGNPTTKTFRVTLALPDDTPLMIGMSIEANIIVHESKDALLLPAEAVDGGHVFTINGSRLERRPVKTGIRGNRMVEILDGVTDDSQIAITAEANSSLSDGLRVRIIKKPSS